MEIDATFWVAISFIIFFVGLIYLKIPQKITETLDGFLQKIKAENLNVIPSAENLDDLWFYMNIRIFLECFRVFCIIKS